MEEQGLRQVDILEKCLPYCEEFGVRIGRNDLSQYVTGKVSPRQDKLSILGLALNVNEAWLMGFDVPKQRQQTVSSLATKKFPLLVEKAWEVPKDAGESLECYVEAGAEIEADFVFRAKGDSMVNARIHDGDIVFIRQQSTVENGEIAVVVINNEATLKRVYHYKDQSLVILRAENPAYKELYFANEELNDLHILGKAIAFQSVVK